MYLEHFGLHEAPFQTTPDTEFFFSGGNRGNTLNALSYAIKHGQGIVKITGEVGSGKTMLCHMLLERLSDSAVAVCLTNPSLSRDEILYTIAEEVGMPLPEGRQHILMRSLQERLVEICAGGKQVVVLVDEAHAMPTDSLEEIRLLSNLESNRHQLLQLVLLGQPELNSRLAPMEMRPLKERITHNFMLEQLSRGDIANYLTFRMRTAGYDGPMVFAPAAIELITHHSEGIIRRVNILADKALLAAFTHGVKIVEKREALKAVQEAQFQNLHMPAKEPKKFSYWPAAALATFACAGALVYTSGPLLLTESASKETVNANAAPATVLNPISIPVPTTEAAGAPSTETTPKVHAPSSATPSDSSAVPAPSQNGKNEAPALAQEAVETTKPITEPAATVPLPPQPSAAPVATTAKPVLTTDKMLTAEYLAETEDWIRKTPDNSYVIQLLNLEASASELINTYLGDYSRKLNPQQLRVYRSNLSGKDKIGVIYGEFDSRDEAMLALNQLPREIQSAKPYVRSVTKLRPSTTESPRFAPHVASR